MITSKAHQLYNFMKSNYWFDNVSIQSSFDINIYDINQINIFFNMIFVVEQFVLEEGLQKVIFVDLSMSKMRTIDNE